MGESKIRPKQRDSSRDPGAAGVRAPLPGESSSNDIRIPEEATSADVPIKLPSKTPDPEATLVDPDATMVDYDPTASPPRSPRARAPRSAPGSRDPGLFVSAAVLQPGDVLGDRYEILQLLGEGGMGAVYKARDCEVDRFVALKVIRPELASSPAILARFKQELLLAHQVTHRNVIRIYDLAEAEGMKFITMEFVEGVDLRRLLLDRGKFAPAEAVEIIRQVCLALEAAHTVGVIHRDLKPQNIMQDKQGRILVMDFGLARSVASEGMTQTGALVGTMEYMSPEQALGEELDQRSDLFTLGLIFYELLTGKMPFKADSAVASLLKRTRERAAPVTQEDNTIPRALSGIVSKCLEPDSKLRYQTAAEILADFEAWQGGRAAATLHFPSAVGPWARSYPWHWIGAAVAVLVLATAGYLFRAKLFAPSVAPTTSGPVVSLAIVPFRNASGDASLDWLGSTLVEILNTEVGQSARVRTISPDRVHQILSDLRISPSTILDPGTLGRLAESSSADTVVSGQFVRFGNQIRIDATLQDLKHERRVPLKIDAGGEKDIPDAASRLANAIRQNLSVSPGIIKELKASAFQPSTKSVVALREYNQGSELLRNGKNLEAVKQLEAATKDDPGFSLAYSKLAQAYANLGHDNEAEQASKKAVEVAENLPEAEKYVVAAAHAQIVRDYRKAIAAYETLARLSPDNTDVQLTLARNYENSNDFANARKHYEQVLALNPKDIAALVAMGRVEVMSGNDQASLDPLTRALSLTIQDDNQEQRALVLHLLGMAYADLNKADEALLNYQQSLEIRRRLGQKQGAADTLNMIALLYVGLGKSDLALKNYKEALQTYRDIGDKQDAGTVLLNIGQFYDDHGKYDDALKLFKESLQIQREVGNESNQALCLNNIGNTYLFKADYENARTYFEQALQLREKFGVSSDIADTLHNLAETDVMTGQYDQALARYLRALDLRRNANDKQGAAKESDSLGMLFEYQGRYGAAVKARGEAVNTFRELRDRSYWMAITLSSYGESLLQVGRFEDAIKAWNEALSLARELKNRFIIAQISNWQGDSFLYRGDLQSATPLIETALQMARGTGDHHLILQCRFDAAKLALKRGQSRAAIQALRELAAEADSLGLKHLAIESSLVYVEALISRRDYPQAQAELQRASERSDKLGLRMLSARSNFLMGKLLLAMDNPADAATRLSATVRILDDIRGESGAETLLQRPDLMSMYTEASHGSHFEQ